MLLAYLPWINIFFSSFVLGRNDESEHPYLVPDLRGKSFSFHCWVLMLAMDLTYIPLLRWSTFILYLIYWFIETFYHENLKFSDSFCVDEDIFILHSVNMFYHIDLCIINCTLNLGLNPVWAWCMILLMCFQFCLLIFFQDFLSILIKKICL